MTEQELRNKAKEDYPMGTKYYCADDNREYTARGSSYYIYNNGDEVTDGHGGFVRYNGTWAKKVKNELDIAREIIYED